MPINSAETRRAACAAFSWYVAPGVTPLATPDAEWRVEVGWGVFFPAAWVPEGSDHNTETRDYLNTLYGMTNPDIEPLVDLYLDADTIVDKAVSARELKVLVNVENR